jgi:hypothetical protein
MPPEGTPTRLAGPVVTPDTGRPEEPLYTANAPTSVNFIRVLSVMAPAAGYDWLYERNQSWLPPNPLDWRSGWSYRSRRQRMTVTWFVLSIKPAEAPAGDYFERQEVVTGSPFEWRGDSLILNPGDALLWRSDDRRESEEDKERIRREMQRIEDSYGRPQGTLKAQEWHWKHYPPKPRPRIYVAGVVY